jgi:hypothetical protein
MEVGGLVLNSQIFENDGTDDRAKSGSAVGFADA